MNIQGGSPRTLDREKVVELARLARIALAPNFHARSAHGVTFEKLAAQLLFTFEVRRDPRPGHPHGHIFTQNWGGEVYRVDFDLATNDAGDLILIVTGWKLEE